MCKKHKRIRIPLPSFVRKPLSSATSRRPDLYVQPGFTQPHHYFGCVFAAEECRCFLCSHQCAHALISERPGRLLMRVVSCSRRHLRKMWMQFRQMTRGTMHLHALACECNLGRQRVEFA